jgi:predicted nucleotidyltransferase
MERSVREQILALLKGMPVAAAFIYGSVAHGTAIPNSDIDVFVVLEHDLPGEQISELRSRFHDVQRCLGYMPDPQFPVEIFTVAAIGDALAAVEPDEDQQEIRRALMDKKIMLTGSVEFLP